MLGSCDGGKCSMIHDQPVRGDEGFARVFPPGGPCVRAIALACVREENESFLCNCDVVSACRQEQECIDCGFVIVELC